MMSLAKSRGRSLFFAIGVPLHVAVNDDRRLAAVRVCNPWTCEVQDGDDGLSGVDADVGQDGVEPLATTSKLPERVVDAGRPIDARDEFPARALTSGETVAVNAEGELDHPRNAVRFAIASIVGERLGISARRFHDAVEMPFADHAKVG